MLPCAAAGSTCTRFLLHRLSHRALWRHSPRHSLLKAPPQRCAAVAAEGGRNSEGAATVFSSAAPSRSDTDAATAPAATIATAPTASSSNPSSSSNNPSSSSSPSSSSGSGRTNSSPPPEQQQASLLAALAQGARLTTAAHWAWSLVLREGDVAVDATAGNGHDTLQLARAVGPSGTVYAFDVQEAAIDATRALVREGEAQDFGGGSGVGYDVRCVLGCHSTMHEHVPSNAARAVIFNLGYLPGGDKAVVTSIKTTLDAIECGLEALAQGGLLSVLAYTGHPGGQEEYEAVRGLVAGLSPQYWVSTEHRLLNRPSAPILLLVWRR